jgi:DNA primase
MVYNTNHVIENLCLEELLKKITEYDVYHHYLGSKFKVGQIMSSPFREDKHPSFGVFKSSNGALLWKDQATGKTGNIVTFVKEIENLYHNKQALKLIYDKFVKGIIQPTTEGIRVREHYDRLRKSISIKRQNFTKNDDEYWQQYHISRETLKKYNVYPITFFWVDDVLQPFTYTKDSPMYAYKIFDKFKIYRPYSQYKKDKWRTNCSTIDIQGFEQLPEEGDLLILTKSLKDIMVLDELGYTAVALQSENDKLNYKIFNNLSERFKKIVILFDNDEPGKESAAKLASEYNIEYCFIDSSIYELYNVKDISDYIHIFGKEQTIKLLKSLIKNESANS